MRTEVIVALVTGIFTLAGVIITVLFGNKKTEKQIKEQNDLTLYRIQQLEIKQNQHNKLVERMYSAEERIHVLEERQKTANHRIDDLEHRNAS